MSDQTDEKTAALKKEHERLRQSNQQHATNLQKAGAGIDPSGVLYQRLNMLTEYLLGDTDQPERLEFEIVFEGAMNEILREATSQARQAQIMQGVPSQVPNGGPKIQMPGR